MRHPHQLAKARFRLDLAFHRLFGVGRVSESVREGICRVLGSLSQRARTDVEGWSTSFSLKKERAKRVTKNR